MAGARALVCTVCLVLICCVRVPKQTYLQEVAGGEGSAETMRIHLFELGRRALSAIETAADSISREVDDPEVRRNALLWKINAGPAFQEAALQADPLGGAGESYVLTVQMYRFFENGPGRDAFAAGQPIALSALQTLERDASRVFAQSFAGDSVPQRVRDRLERWIDTHPAGTIAFRRPALSQDWPVITAGFGAGMGASFSRIDEVLKAISNRLAFADENLLKQLGWHFRLLASDALVQAQGDSTLASSTLALRQLGALAETWPAWVDWERTATLASVDSQRIETLASLSSEREAILAGVDRERSAVMNDLRRERMATVAALDSSVAKSFEQADRLVDHVALRVAQLLLILLAGVAIIVFGLRLGHHTTEQRGGWSARAMADGRHAKH